MPKANAQTHSTTRQKILDAATELVAAVGWQQVTTRRVAARAGVNQALVHYHFGSVDRLVRQAIISGLESAMAEPTERLLGSSSPGEGVRQLSDWLRAFDMSSAMAILSAEALAYATRDTELREWLAGLLVDIRAQLTAGITAAQAAGEVRGDVTAQALATLTAALLDGLIFHRLVDPQLSAEEMAATLDALLAPNVLKGERDTGD